MTGVFILSNWFSSLLWRLNRRECVSIHQPRGDSCLFSHRSMKTSKLRVTGLCKGNSPVIGEFLAQRASNAENVSILIWWCHHVVMKINGALDKLFAIRVVVNHKYIQSRMIFIIYPVIFVIDTFDYRILTDTRPNPVITVPTDTLTTIKLKVSRK